MLYFDDAQCNTTHGGNFRLRNKNITQLESSSKRQYSIWIRCIWTTLLLNKLGACQDEPLYVHISSSKTKLYVSSLSLDPPKVALVLQAPVFNRPMRQK
jgi:hypothetical protein